MEHYIELIDGIRIEAFPKAEQPETIKEDKLTLDTTGEYLHVGSRKRIPKRTTKRDTIAQQRGELLCRNLHRLIAESDTILSNSRMFLAPVPIQNGLAYFGTSGFQNPTLGVYIEWWRHHKCSWIIDEFGEKQPLIYIAGSPLSGANKCAYVGAEGNSYGVSVTKFAPFWQSFVNVNTRYTEATQRYEAYTIEEVIERLFG
ncbi:MAG: hypothetical protein J6U52_04470 [Alistipes sp.]|nr:hypothetical protein [Alistipes sp.]